MYIDSYGLTAEGAAIGAIIGGVVGAVGGAIVGAGGGTVVAPGFGTVGGGIAGAGQGAINGAAVGAVIGDFLSNIYEMAKGGKQNIDNEYVRDVQNSKPTDPCEYLRNLYNNTCDKQERRKIKQAMKRYNCDNKNRFN